MHADIGAHRQYRIEHAENAGTRHLLFMVNVEADRKMIDGIDSRPNRGWNGIVLREKQPGEYARPRTNSAYALRQRADKRRPQQGFSARHREDFRSIVAAKTVDKALEQLC